MASDVVQSVRKFITLAQLEQQTYKHLGIPTNLIYNNRDIKDGQYVSSETQTITIEELKKEYNLEGIKKARLSWHLATYMSLNTYYGDNDRSWSEEVLSYQIEKSFIERLEAQGFYTELDAKPKTMGYGFIGDSVPYVEIFEGYPRQSNLPTDLWWQTLKRALEKVVPSEGVIKLTLKDKDEGDTLFLTFENREKFFNLLTHDGVSTYMNASGEIAFRFMSTIHGDNRAGLLDYQTQKYIPLGGIYLSNIRVPQMPIFI